MFEQQDFAHRGGEGARVRSRVKTPSLAGHIEAVAGATPCSAVAAEEKVLPQHTVPLQFTEQIKLFWSREHIPQRMRQRITSI